MSLSKAFQPSHGAFKAFLEPEVLNLRTASPTWSFGSDILEAANHYYLQRPVNELPEIALTNSPSLTAAWYTSPFRGERDLIAINFGLMEAVRLIAFDIFGPGEETDGQPLQLGTVTSGVCNSISERIAAFLELGTPLGTSASVSPRRKAFVDAIISDALQFVVLHEFSHILLGHSRGDLHILRMKFSDHAIMTFSMNDEFDADRMAARLHAAMRQPQNPEFQGMELAGPTLVLSVLGLFERFRNYTDVYDTPHAHPPAYERLYNIRMLYAYGDGDMYWNVGGEGEIRLARQHLEPHPDAVKFSDMVGKTILSAFHGIRQLGSPLSQLVEQGCKEEITPQHKESFYHELLRWLFLGSPRKIIQHIFEAINDCKRHLAGNVADEDLIFYSRAECLISNAIERLKNFDDPSVSYALSEVIARHNSH